MASLAPLLFLLALTLSLHFSYGENVQKRDIARSEKVDHKHDGNVQKRDLNGDEKLTQKHDTHMQKRDILGNGKLAPNYDTNVEKRDIKEVDKLAHNSDENLQISDMSKSKKLVQIYNEEKEALRRIFSHGVVAGTGYDSRESDLGSNPQRDQVILEDTPRHRNTIVEEAPNYTLRRRGLLPDEEEALIDDAVLGRQAEEREDTVPRRPVDHGHSGDEHTRVYLNEWVVHVSGGKDLAATLARDLGYTFHGQIGDFEDVYRMVKDDHPHTHKRAAPTLTLHLNTQDRVVWAEQQFIKERTKRGPMPFEAVPLQDGGSYNPDTPLSRSKRHADWEQEERKRMVKSKKKKSSRTNMVAEALEMEKKFNDELWDHQWYLFDTRTRSDLPRLDLQVTSVWEQGITGKGVRISVLDDGMEWRHTDLRDSYDPDISYDMNNDTSDPTPHYDKNLSNSHGTRCAGEIGMAPNNHKCGVGVAYGAKLGAIRMLDGPVSDITEGRALSHALDLVDIVSCSWGPTDDGTRVEGPGTMAQASILKGSTLGRKGRGTIYVWAAGNGGSAGDNCNCDGYTSSIMTLSISSASETGKFPWYGERCASTLATAYSSGAYTDQKIATTDLHDQCTIKFSGTSAAAPLAAGIMALALEANPKLTWRDMQHAVVWSSEWGPLSHNNGWTTNARSLKVNPRFGFGLLSARGLVDLARNWTNVGDQKICKVKAESRSGSELSSGKAVTLTFHSGGCSGETGGDEGGGEEEGKEVRWLEHVQAVITINYTRRGALNINLTSPSGTTTELLTERVGDVSNKGFTSWPFMSVHTWGEDPNGTWTLKIADNTNTSTEESGTVGEVELVLYGTKEAPPHMLQTRQYRILASQVEEKERRSEDEDKIYLSAEQLRTLSWDQLMQLLTKSTRSTMSRGDVEFLLKEKKLRQTLQTLHHQHKGTRDTDQPIWSRVLDEVESRWYKEESHY